MENAPTLVQLLEEIQKIQRSVHHIEKDLVGKSSIVHSESCPGKSEDHSDVILQKIADDVQFLKHCQMESNAEKLLKPVVRGLEKVLLPPGMLEEYSSPIKSIRTQIWEEEQAFLKDCIQIRTNETDIIPGNSIEANSFKAIKALVPKPVGRGLTIMISNFLSMPLTELCNMYGEDVDIVGSLVRQVPAGTQEAFSLLSTESFMEISLSYHLDETDIDLHFHVGINADEEIWLLAAFSPESAGWSVWDYLRDAPGDSSCRMDVKELKWQQVNETVEFVIQLGKFIAKITLLPGSLLFLSVEVMELSESLFKPRECLALVGRNEDGIISEEDSRKESLDTLKYMKISCSHGCVVVLTNLLNVPLEKGQYYLSSSQVNNFMPTTLVALDKKLFFAAASNGISGIFGYQIYSTDLQFAVTFQADAEKGNSFAVAFLPSSAKIDSDKINELNQPDKWITRPDRKYIKLKGEVGQIIECRNIRVQVSMSPEEKSTLNVFVCTF